MPDRLPFDSGSPEEQPDEDAGSPDGDEPEATPEQKRLHKTAMEIAAGLVLGIRDDNKAVMRQLVDVVFFMLSVSHAFGGRFVEHSGAGDEGEPQMRLIDAMTEEPMDSNMILQRINIMMQMVREAAGKASDEQTDQLTEDDL